MFSFLLWLVLQDIVLSCAYFLLIYLSFCTIFWMSLILLSMRNNMNRECSGGSLLGTGSSHHYLVTTDLCFVIHYRIGSDCSLWAQTSRVDFGKWLH